ncbi:hypothetical protein GRI38_12195 [Altererythrobacter aurantiacus]|uniref:O-antigen ligase-related domain-containing protein n=1 Tax=Parapontixanthobacter aurantiacus TaxID=1463599 RepID=A0A844ZI36_9SPHN|nr:O-antigen ligase family protein [Parapontixanthobacter aurantiacus]MXO86786.1 hypothetical protein [Parapontixanthobacter aurantiacus]
MDVSSLIVLRPVTFIALLIACVASTRMSVSQARIPIALGLTGLVLAATQLVPIPYDIWAGLPGRSAYAQAASIAGIDDGWRFVTMSPARTVNALAALALPVAVLLLIARALPERSDGTVRIICLIAFASAILALLQLSGDPRGPLYTYRLTTVGAPVGLFANRNHQAVFLAAILPFVAQLVVARYKKKKALDSIALSMIGAAALFAFVCVITGSRAGFLALVISAGFSAWIVQANRAPVPAKGKASKRYAGLIGAAALGGIAVVAWLVTSTDTLLWRRFQSSSLADEERATLLPTTWQMVQDFFPVGSGFGSFEQTYYRYEGLDNLSRYYVNQAHMDWLQFALEGGVVAIAMMLIFSFWVVARGVALLRAETKGNQWSRQVAALSFILVFGMGSLFDYPLRVPLAAAIFAVCCALLAQPKRT